MFSSLVQVPELESQANEINQLSLAVSLDATPQWHSTSRLLYRLDQGPWQDVRQTTVWWTSSSCDPWTPLTKNAQKRQCLIKSYIHRCAFIYSEQIGTVQLHHTLRWLLRRKYKVHQYHLLCQVNSSSSHYEAKLRATQYVGISA